MAPWIISAQTLYIQGQSGGKDEKLPRLVLKRVSLLKLAYRLH